MSQNNILDSLKRQFDYVGGAYEGRVVVGKDGKWAHARTDDGQMAYPDWYESASNFQNGKARVRLGGEVFLIDHDGRILDEEA